MAENNQIPFTNCSFFVFPLRVDDASRLDAFLESSPAWTRVDDPFDCQYLLCYANTILKNRLFQTYAYGPLGDIALPAFRERIGGNLQREVCASPRLEGLRLYVFPTGVGFIELEVSYAGMQLDEMAEYIFLLRSLRNNRQQEYLRYEPGESDLETILEDVLPQGKTDTVLCFNNTSAVKRQAMVFSLVSTGHIDGCDQGDETLDKYRYRLCHGYRSGFPYEPPQKMLSNPFGNGYDYSTQYEIMYNVNSDSYWGGSQDGLVCITRKPYRFQFDHLRNDYRFSYLILLNQRLSSLNFVDRILALSQDGDGIVKVHDEIVDLKTRWSFRVISDDGIVQNIYSKMYRILELDELMKDIEESNDQLLQKKQLEQEKNEKRTIGFLTALSILAVSSALIDLSDYIEKAATFDLSAIVSLGINVALIAFVVTFVFFPINKR